MMRENNFCDKNYIYAEYKNGYMKAPPFFLSSIDLCYYILVIFMVLDVISNILWGFRPCGLECFHVIFSVIFPNFSSM